MAVLQDDFYYFYAIAQIARAGGNPYDLEVLTDEMRRLGWEAPGLVLGNGYPPWCLPFLYLFSFLPFGFARMAWLLTAAFVIACCLAWILRDPLFRFKLESRSRLILALLCWFPLVETLIYRQWGFLILLSLCLWVYLSSRKRDLLAGCALSLGFVKPHLLGLLYLAIAITMLRRKSWKFFAGCVIGFGSQLLLLSAFFGFAETGLLLRTYLLNASQYIAVSNQFFLANFGQLTSYYFHFDSGPKIVFLLGLAVALVLSLDKHVSYDKLLLVILPLSIASSPYSWGHDFTLLAIPYLVAAAELFKRSTKLALLVLVSQLLLYLALTDRSYLEMFKCFVPLTLFMLWCWLIYCQKKKYFSALPELALK